MTVGKANQRSQRITGDALVGTVPPKASRERLADLECIDTKVPELVDQTMPKGERHGPGKTRWEGFRPIYSEVSLVGHHPVNIKRLELR